MQSLITIANMTRRFGGIRLCDEAIMLTSAIKVSLYMCVEWVEMSHRQVQ